jgi:hypothetical protein
MKIDLMSEGEERRRSEVERLMRIEVEHLPGVGEKVAESLIRAGIETAAELAAAKMDSLVALPGIGAKTAEKLLAVAREALAQRAVEVDAVLSRRAAEEAATAEEVATAAEATTTAEERPAGREEAARRRAARRRRRPAQRGTGGGRACADPQAQQRGRAGSREAIGVATPGPGGIGAASGCGPGGRCQESNRGRQEWS